MPKLDVTREELEALIQATMLHRINHDGEFDYGVMLSCLHLKLEEALELWINGGTIEIPVTPALRKLGVCNHEIVYQPHPDECVRHG